jgi:hypothetical protein
MGSRWTVIFGGKCISFMEAGLSRSSSSWNTHLTKLSYVFGGSWSMEDNDGGFTSLLSVVPRGTKKRGWDIEDTGPRVGFLSGIKLRVDINDSDTRITSRMFHIVISYGSDTGFVLTWNDIPITTEPSRFLRSPMRLAMGSFPPCPLILRLRHALTGCARARV